MATYTPNIPQPGDIPAFSQDQILQNFQSIDDGTNGFANNHISLTNSTVGQRGKHKYIHMPVQSPNGPATAVGEGAIYTKTGTGSQPQMFWRPQSTLAAGNEVQMTGVIPVNSSTGYTFLPGGILMQWSRASSVVSGSTVTFPIAFSAPVYNVQVTFRNNTGSQRRWVSTGSSNATGFTIRILDQNGTAMTEDVFWLAVGPI